VVGRRRLSVTFIRLSYFVFIAWIIFAQNVCERADPICFDVSVRKIAHAGDDYCMETGGHSANSGVNAAVVHEVLRWHSVGVVPNLGRHRVRSSVLVSQLQV